MTPLLAISLFFLAVPIAVMRSRYGRQWYLRPYGMFVITAVIYHGISEVIIRATGAERLAIYRVAQPQIDAGVFVASLGLLAMTLGYVMVSPPRPTEGTIDMENLKRAFDWRVFGILMIPLTLTTSHGNGYAGAALTGQGVTQAGLSSEFFVPLMALTTFSFLLRHPRSWIPAIAVQSIVMGVAGQRLEIIVAAVAVAAMCARVGIKPTLNQVAAIVTLAVIGLLGISSARAIQGRGIFQTNSGVTARISAMVQGLEHPSVQSAHGGNPLQELGLRLEANSLAGAIMYEFDVNGKDPIGWDGPKAALITSLPSFMDPGKIQQLQALDYTPKNQVRHQLGVEDVDYIAGAVVTFLGNLGPPMNTVFDLFVGLILGALDNLVMRRITLWRIVSYLLVAQSALFFERGIDFYLVSLRAFLVFVIGASVLGAFARAIDPGARWQMTTALRQMSPRPPLRVAGTPRSGPAVGRS